MKFLKTIFQLTTHIFFVIIFFSTANSKTIDKFDESKYVSDYFLGTLYLKENQYENSFHIFKRLDGLERSHSKFSNQYLFSLINSGNFRLAFQYSKKIEKQKLSTFESDLIIGFYYLKNKKYNLANEYFLRLKNKNTQFILNEFVLNSLINWTNFNNLNFIQAEKKINEINLKYKNLKRIQNAFLHCYYDTKKTEEFFEKLRLSNDTDFSRYSYFYLVHLFEKGKFDKINKILKSSLEKYPRNLLLNQFKIDYKNDRYKVDFNCKDPTHVIAEVFYIVASALSTQSLYNFSTFYLNLAKYLNSDFVTFEILLAENFYNLGSVDIAKNIYNKIGIRGSAFLWFASKQNASILIKEKNKNKALKLLKNNYNKNEEKNMYVKFDYAKFLKNNEKYEKSIEIYSEIISEINKEHPLYPQVTDGRGVALERIGRWDEAEQDLLSSLEVSPNQAYVINYLAYSWIEQGIKIEKSLKMLEKANNLKSNDPYIIDSLGWALFKLGNYQEAKKYLRTAVELLPSDPTVNDHYGDALWKNGDTLQARYYWRYVLNLDDVEENLKQKLKDKLVLGL